MPTPHSNASGRSQAQPRVRKRIPCDVVAGDDRHTGIVLNLSRGGLFVQTDLGADVGHAVAVELAVADRADPIPVEASVVWRRAVPRSLRGVRHSGIGLSVDRAPEAWDQLVAALFEAEGVDAAGPPAAPEPTGATATFRVRLGRVGTPRSTTLEVASGSEEAARRQALARQGEGWVVLDLTRSDAPGKGS